VIARDVPDGPPTRHGLEDLNADGLLDDHGGASPGCRLALMKEDYRRIVVLCSNAGLPRSRAVPRHDLGQSSAMPAIAFCSRVRILNNVVSSNDYGSRFTHLAERASLHHRHHQGVVLES
jgi:hypothetical protein